MLPLAINEHPAIIVMQDARVQTLPLPPFLGVRQIPAGWGSTRVRGKKLGGGGHLRCDGCWFGSSFLRRGDALQLE